MMTQSTGRYSQRPQPLRPWIVAVALVALSLSARGAPGDIDTGFGDGGRVLSGGIAVPMPDAGIAVGRNHAYGFEVEFLNAQGKPNAALGSGGRTVVMLPPAPKAYLGTYSLRMPDGGLVFAGWVPNGSGSGAQSVPALLRLTPRGDVDTSFGPAGNGIVLLDRASAIGGLAQQPDGRLLVVLLDAEITGDEMGTSCVSATYRIGRLSRDGSVDPGYGEGGTAIVPDLASRACMAPTLFAADATGAAVIGDTSQLRRITADGRIDMNFGSSTGVAVPPFAGEILGGAMTPSGVLLLHSDQAFGRLSPDGRVDLPFGGGDGVLPLWESRGLVLDRVGSIALTPDGRHVYAQTEVSADYMGDRICQVVLRMSIDGVPDGDFGQDGRSCISFGFVYGAGRPVVLDNEQPVVELSEHGVAHFYRLVVDSTPSGGALSLKVNFNSSAVDQADGYVTLTVVRTAGRDGFASVNYTTVAGTAIPGSDYVESSGLLEWAPGDASERIVTVRTLRDRLPEELKAFSLELREPDGALVIGGSQLVTIVTIASPPGGGTPPPPVVTPPAPERESSGGGGTADGLLVLLLLLLAGVARVSRTDGKSCRSVQVVVVLCLGIALWRGEANAAGTIDPTFGSSGQVAMDDQFVLDVVPTSADRMLVLSCPGNSWEYSCYNSLLLRRLTADGWPDPAFGEGTTWILDADGYPTAITQRPDGSLLVAGRADDGTGFLATATANGQRDPVFGGQAVLKLAQPVRALVVQGDGKLLVGTVPDGPHFNGCSAPGWTLQRLGASGAPDATFGAGGAVTSSMIHGAEQAQCELKKIWSEPGGEIVFQAAAGLQRLRADGSLDTTFGSADGLAAMRGTVTRTTDGGFLDIALMSNRWIVQRFDSNGRNDPTFGSGGRIDLDVAGMLSDFIMIDQQSVERFAAVEDGKHYYASAFVSGRLKSTGEVQSGTFIFRFRADGTVDTAYGEGGRVQMSRALPLGSRGLFTQSDGRLIVATGGPIYRLLTGDEPSPGIVSAAYADPVPVVEGGRARVVVSRTAGDTTAISVRYLNVVHLPTGNDAVPGLDFLPVSGVLSWAAGDHSDRIVEVPTIDDTIDESAVEFLVFQIVPVEGAPIITSAHAWVPIADDDPSPATPAPPTPTPPTPPPSGSRGGGGAIQLPEVIALLGLWAAGVRRRWGESAGLRARAAAFPRGTGRRVGTAAPLRTPQELDAARDRG